jgi:hypothetical protein
MLWGWVCGHVKESCVWVYYGGGVKACDFELDEYIEAPISA